FIWMASSIDRSGIGAVAVRLYARGRRNADRLADLRFDLGGGVRMLLQEIAGVIFALADFLAFVRVPRTGFFDHAVRDAELDDFAFARDALAVQNVEKRFAERRRHLVLHDLHAR